MRRSLVAPLHFANPRDVFGVLLPVLERARLPPLLKQPQMIGPLVAAGIAQTVDRVSGVGLSSVFVFLELEVIAQIIEFDVPVDNQASREIVQSRHPQSEVPLRVRNGQFLARLPLAKFGNVFPRESFAVLALKTSEEFDGSPPPRALAASTPVIGLRRRKVQDARKFAIVFMLHRAWFRLTTHAHLDDANTKLQHYMQRSGAELKDCSLWLRNPTAGAPVGTLALAASGLASASSPRGKRKSSAMKAVDRVAAPTEGKALDAHSTVCCPPKSK